jgi:hypothetical protein
MSIKTKKHKHSVHHRRRKRRYSHNHSLHHQKKTHKRINRKRREISAIPGTKSIPIFTTPNKQYNEMIPVNIKQPQGNIIPGLRDYMKNM